MPIQPVPIASRIRLVADLLTTDLTIYPMAVRRQAIAWPRRIAVTGLWRFAITRRRGLAIRLSRQRSALADGRPVNARAIGVTTIPVSVIATPVKVVGTVVVEEVRLRRAVDILIGTHRRGRRRRRWRRVIIPRRRRIIAPHRKIGTGNPATISLPVDIAPGSAWQAVDDSDPRAGGQDNLHAVLRTRSTALIECTSRDGNGRRRGGPSKGGCSNGNGRRDQDSLDSFQWSTHRFGTS